MNSGNTQGKNTSSVLPSNIIKDTVKTQKGGAIVKDSADEYEEDYENAYDEDFVDEDEEETFKKTAADFAKQLNQLKTVNDKRKEIVEKMEKEVVATKGTMGGMQSK